MSSTEASFLRYFSTIGRRSLVSRSCALNIDLHYQCLNEVVNFGKSDGKRSAFGGHRSPFGVRKKSVSVGGQLPVLSCQVSVLSSEPTGGQPLTYDFRLP